MDMIGKYNHDDGKERGVTRYRGALARCPMQKGRSKIKFLQNQVIHHPALSIKLKMTLEREEFADTRFQNPGFVEGS